MSANKSILNPPNGLCQHGEGACCIWCIGAPSKLSPEDQLREELECMKGEFDD